MTDQPGTMLEYEFRTTRRLLVWMTAILGSLVAISAAALLIPTDSVMSLLFSGASLGMWFISMVTAGDNVFRRAFNRLPFDAEITDLERPGEHGRTEALADD